MNGTNEPMDQMSGPVTCQVPAHEIFQVIVRHPVHEKRPLGLLRRRGGLAALVCVAGGRGGVRGRGSRVGVCPQPGTSAPLIWSVGPFIGPFIWSVGPFTTHINKRDWTRDEDPPPHLLRVEGLRGRVAVIPAHARGGVGARALKGEAPGRRVISVPTRHVFARVNSRLDRGKHVYFFRFTEGNKITRF